MIKHQFPYKQQVFFHKSSFYRLIYCLLTQLTRKVGLGETVKVVGLRNVNKRLGIKANIAPGEFLRELGMRPVSGDAGSRACQFAIEQTPANTRGSSSVGHQWCDYVREIREIHWYVWHRWRGMCPRRLERKMTRSCNICGSSVCKQHDEVITRHQACADAVTMGVAEMVSDDSDKCCWRDRWLRECRHKYEKQSDNERSISMTFAHFEN